jgi:hypothetical protein
MYLKWRTVGEGEKGMGEKGGRGVSIQPTRDQSNSRHDTEEGFQVSKRGDQGVGQGFPSKGGLPKELGHAPLYIMLIMCILC